jgi:POT family proton-dependent oligopeptide transporter
VLIISYLAYLPSILLLILTKSFSGIALTMLTIGFAAGIFKPLISGTVRAVTDSTNKTLGFGIFYAMVNVGGSFGPIVMGRLRAISWNYAFIAAAITIFIMFLVTIFFYKEPPRELRPVPISEKIKEIFQVLGDYHFSVFLVFLGVFFWLPFWAFFNLVALYIDGSLDTAQLYLNVKSVLGAPVANFISRIDENGTRRILGETIAHTGYIIMILQVPVSRIVEKFKAMAAFSTGMLIAVAGFAFLGFAKIGHPAWVLFGIFLFAVGEMASSPRIQEYITWLAPKEKAGLYMGAVFLSVFIGAVLSGVIYTSLYGYFEGIGKIAWVWYVLGAHTVLGVIAINWSVRRIGHLQERTT